MASTDPCQEKIGLKFSFFLDPLDLGGYCSNKNPLIPQPVPADCALEDDLTLVVIKDPDDKCLAVKQHRRQKLLSIIK